jgi:hypothetical protein
MELKSVFQVHGSAIPALVEFCDPRIISWNYLNLESFVV